MQSDIKGTSTAELVKLECIEAMKPMKKEGNPSLIETNRRLPKNLLLALSPDEMEVAGLGSPNVEKRESVLHSRFMRSRRLENSQSDRTTWPDINRDGKT